MDIKSKISVTISPTDAAALFKTAVMDHLQSQFGISADDKNVEVQFKATMQYDQYDCGPGSPEFSGVEVTIDQEPPTQKRCPRYDR